MKYTAHNIYYVLCSFDNFEWTVVFLVHSSEDLTEEKNGEN